jgi:hypothetical protein
MVVPVSKYILTEPRAKVTSSILLADLGQDTYPFFIRVLGYFPEDHVHFSIIRGDTLFMLRALGFRRPGAPARLHTPSETSEGSAGDRTRKACGD